MPQPLAILDPSSRVALRPGDVPRDQHVDALYVHVPFCFHKCHYCDFYSITRQTPDRMARFVDLVLAEADLWRQEGPTVRPRTIFFGGGTPSLLPIGQMDRLLAGLRERFDFSLLDEWTVEVNPATTDLDYCRLLRRRGVTRLSFGAQSFDERELAQLERHHKPEQVGQSIAIARDAGFERLNVDLIFAIPGQTLESWQRSLDTALALGTPHVSAYALTYEPNTPMAVKKRLGQVRSASEELELEMLMHTRQVLGEAGLEAYEVSNFAVPGEACRHNLNYWTGGSYLGLGPSAASHVHGTRFRNKPHLGEWEQALDRRELPVVDFERLTDRQRRGETVMLMLRLRDGVDRDAYAARFGSDVADDFADAIAPLRDNGLLLISPNRVSLTEKAIPVADAVAAEFLG
jgi:oxygen-independent coproporphyrinogen-3 oxidase